MFNSVIEWSNIIQLFARWAAESITISVPDSHALWSRAEDVKFVEVLVRCARRHYYTLNIFAVRAASLLHLKYISPLIYYQLIGDLKYIVSE